MAIITWILNTSLHVALILMVIQGRVEGRSPYLETNEGPYSSDANVKAIQVPVCGVNTICGYLQANAKGINRQRMCACILGNCPLAWDPFDGHSVTQGSDQYKFCGKVAPISTCKDGEIAYTSRTVFSKLTDEKTSQEDHINCNCPESHSYEMSNQHFGDLGEENEVLDVSYTCVLLPLCRTGDICKFASETQTPDTFLVNRKCKCPSGLNCPTISESGQIESFSMGSGLVHPILCQR